MVQVRRDQKRRLACVVQQLREAFQYQGVQSRSIEKHFFCEMMKMTTFPHKNNTIQVEIFCNNAGINAYVAGWKRFFSISSFLWLEMICFHFLVGGRFFFFFFDDWKRCFLVTGGCFPFLSFLWLEGVSLFLFFFGG